ncbi:hypothetical protein RZN22_00975 [Bacillaceae bacterium S4-13-58]
MDDYKNQEPGFNTWPNDRDDLQNNQQGGQGNQQVVAETKDVVFDKGYPNDDFDEEIAQEVAIDRKDFPHEPIRNQEKETEMKSDVPVGWGWTGVILSFLSFFMMPVILGAAGIISGFVARRRGANTLGNTAIVVGVISIVLSLFFAPFT